MKLITSESVSCGHPDKVADQISDAILDHCISNDPESHVAVETLCTTNKVVVAGEVSTKADMSVSTIDALVRNVVKDIGYDFNGFDYERLHVENYIHSQSPDIAFGVNERDGHEQGAGDQGIMFGYAEGASETEFMPIPIYYANKMMSHFEKIRRTREFWKEWLLPDAKCQLTFDFEDEKNPILKAVVLSHQHKAGIDKKAFADFVVSQIPEVVPQKHLVGDFKIVGPDDKVDYDDKNSIWVYVNPAGEFVTGGPDGDTGLTGRKIIVDNYGSAAKVGGGCVDKETEFLTPTGWKKIVDFSSNDLVAQWDDGKMSFVNGEFVKLPKTRMYHVYSPSTIDMVLSDNHNFLYRTSKGHYHKIPFQQVVDAYHSNKNGYRSEMPIFFNYDFADSKGISLTDDEIRLQTAFCADGTILEKKKWYGRIRVKKQYKKDRLEMLLVNCGYEYKKSPDHDYDIYYLNPPLKSKSLCECFRNVNLHQAKILSEEVLQWDGNRRNCFRTTKKEDADFMQFLFMSLTGKTSKIVVDDRVGESKENSKYVTKSICYSVYLGKLKFCSAFRKNQKYYSRMKLSDYDDGDTFMYCINVPSHNLVLRRNNRVFITGNCFSGKDPSKVDRSAAYMCRKVAKDMVKAGKCAKCEISVAYAIGVARPVQVMANSFGTGDDKGLTEFVEKNYDFRPKQIIDFLNLKHPVGWSYRQTAMNGHFGHPEFPWEK